MMKLPVFILTLLLILLLMTACQEEALPTLIDLDATETVVNATAIAAATASVPTITPTQVTPTFPPTFTPTDEPTATPTNVVTPTPEGFSEEGTIYYIYNDDAIASVHGDGTNNEILITFGVGSEISDLSASPDGELLSFVADGSGSAREVFVASRDGSYIQQVSCLGLPDVWEPTWTPDGQSLVFYASQFPDGPRDIYMADFAGSNDCPSGNNQRLLIALGSTEAGGFTWNADQSKLFFGNNSIYVYDVPTTETYQLTQAGAYGPDSSMIHSLTEDRLYFLKTVRERGTGNIGTAFVIVREPSVRPDRPLGVDGALIYATDLIFSSDFNYILIPTNDSIYVYDAIINSNRRLLSGLRAAPDGTFSPDERYIAYTALDLQNSVEQIYVTDLTASNSDQLTTNPEGTIQDLIWLEG